MTAVAMQIPCVVAGETRNGKASFAGKLDTDELLTGTPTVTELTTAHLTISNIAVSTTELTINNETVAIGQAVTFKVLGFQANTSYRLLVSCGTTSTPAQTLRGIARFTTAAAT